MPANPTMTVTVEMTPEVRALVDETIRLHAEIAGDALALAEEIDGAMGFWDADDWVYRLHAIAAKLGDAPPRKDATMRPVEQTGTIRCEAISRTTHAPCRRFASNWCAVPGIAREVALCPIHVSIVRFPASYASTVVIPHDDPDLAAKLAPAEGSAPQ